MAMKRKKGKGERKTCLGKEKRKRKRVLTTFPIFAGKKKGGSIFLPFIRRGKPKGKRKTTYSGPLEVRGKKEKKKGKKEGGHRFFLAEGKKKDRGTSWRREEGRRRK